MGYRSEVVIGIDKEIIFKDSLLLDKLPKIMKTGRLTTKNAFYWKFEDVKWYETYPEIQEVMDYLSELGEEEYGFIRTGEEPGDVETFGTPYSFDMYTYQHIDFPAQHQL